MKIMHHQRIRHWLICAYFVFFLSFVAAKWQCNNTTECTCNSTVFNHPQCSCQVDNAATVRAEYFNGLEISCETTNKSGRGYLSYLNAIKLNETVAQLRIHQCPTPNISFTNFLKNVNIANTHIKSIEILSSYVVDTFEEYHFENLHNVIQIKIQTRMTKLPDTIFNGMSSLENVFLSENALSTLSAKIFANNTKISQLELAFNNLNNLDEGVFSKTYKLNKLNISHNQLSSLPPYLFANATSLRSFYINYNILTTLPEHLFDNCSELKTFMCKGNHLKQLPELIFKHNSKLETLDLSENQITFLQDTLFSSLKKLNTLKLTANRLKSINSKVFANLQSLEILNLCENNLEFFEEKTFQSLVKISSINLNHNPLGKNQSLANFSLFASCADLEKLYLQNTSLTKVTFNRSTVSSILANLDLSFNNLTNFMLEEMLIKLKSSEQSFINVNLFNNNITKISSEGLHNSIEKWCPKSRKDTTITFNLTNNPIECNCHVFHMAKYMQQKPVSNKLINYPNVIFEVSCESPKFLRNKSLDKIPLHDLQCCLDEENIECAGGCRYQYHDSDKNAVIVNCTGERLEKLPEQLLKFDKPYKELLLANNNLINLDGLSSLSSIANITKLSLSHNNLEEVYQLDKFDKLEVLELDNNKIKRLPHELIKQLRDSKTLISLTLHNNPWHCDCQTQDFINLVKFLWKNKTDIKCQNNQSITSLIDDLCISSDSSYIYILLVLLGILIILFIELYYIFEYEIKAWMFANKFCLSFVSKPYTNESKIYDIFISASAKDEAFVVNQFLPRLDDKYKLCIQPRGITAEDLTFKMSNSNRIVIILSLNYLSNELDDDNFRTMFLAALENHIANILVIVLNNIDVEEIDSDLQAFITNKPLKWGKRLFWEKLKYELPHPQRNTGSSDLDEIELATIAIN